MSIIPTGLKKNKTIFKYVTSSFFSLPISLITGFITFRNIDPYFMGIWGTVSVFETYANILRLGIVNGMNRELPFALGAGDKNTAIKYAETTLFYSFLNIIMLLVLIPLIASGFKLNRIYIICVAVSFVKISLSFYTTYLTGTFRSDDHFNKLSNIQFVSLVSKLLFCPLVLLGFYGFLTYEIVFIISGVILLHFYRPFRLKPKFHIKEFRQLLIVGFPIFVTSFLLSSVDTFPRLYIVKYGNEKLLGFYGPILMLLNTVGMLPNALSTYMYPKFSYQIGSNINPKKIWHNLLKIYATSFVFILLIIVVAYFILDFFVVLFPKYSPSLPYLKISLFICPFIFYKLGNMLNVVFKRRDYMFIYVCIYGVVQISSLWLFSIYIKDVLCTVIYAQVVTTFLLFIISLAMNYRVVIQHQKQA